MKKRVLRDGNVAAHADADQSIALLRTVQNATHLAEQQSRSQEVNYQQELQPVLNYNTVTIGPTPLRKRL